MPMCEAERVLKQAKPAPEPTPLQPPPPPPPPKLRPAEGQASGQEGLAIRKEFKTFLRMPRDSLGLYRLVLQELHATNSEGNGVERSGF